MPRSFYDRPTLVVARELMGKVLVHRTREGLASGIIVETEAYIGESDPACHAAPGPTPRNEPLYGEPGYAYVYFNYGVHYLVNAVTEAKGSPAAVLLRALQPLDGIALMRRRRGRLSDKRGIPEHQLCRGPGNLTKAMGIERAENRADLAGDCLYIEDRGIDVATLGEVAWSERIGIRVGTKHPWRCFVAGHPAVSGRTTPTAVAAWVGPGP